MSHRVRSQLLTNHDDRGSREPGAQASGFDGVIKQAARKRDPKSGATQRAGVLRELVRRVGRPDPKPASPEPQPSAGTSKTLVPPMRAVDPATTDGLLDSHPESESETSAALAAIRMLSTEEGASVPAAASPAGPPPAVVSADETPGSGLPSGLLSGPSPGLSGPQASPSAGPAERAVDPALLEQVADRVLEGVRIHQASSRSQIDLRLDLGSFGTVQAKISKTNLNMAYRVVSTRPQIQVAFVAERPAAQAALTIHLGDLKERLERAGLSVRDLTVERADTKHNHEDPRDRRSRGEYQEEDDD